MRKIFLSVCLVLLVILLSITVYPQQNNTLPSYEQGRVWVSELPTFLSNYQSARKQLHDRFSLVNRADFNLDSEISRQLFSDLVRAYLDFKKVRASKDELWFLIFLVKNDSTFLVKNNWTDKQIQDSMAWFSKFLEVREKIKKMDTKYVNDSKVELFLLEHNMELVTIF